MLLQTDNIIYHLVRALRPRQWIKNGFLFAPLIFSGYLLRVELLIQSIIAFIHFSFITSAIYLINDCVDIQKDRLHPIKKDRAIASGRISTNLAVFVAAMLIVVAIPSAFFSVGRYFGIALAIYFLLQIFYNIRLKEVIIIDALTITIGFILRVYAGALAVSLSVSSWLILAVIGLSLLLSFGKRRAEKTLLAAKGISDKQTRSILRHYPDTLLDSMISMSASFAIITYSLFAFRSSPTIDFGNFEYLLPSTLTQAKWLMLTIPVVIYSVARYLYVIYEKREGESPDRILLSDKPLLSASIMWIMMVIFLVTDFSVLF